MKAVIYKTIGPSSHDLARELLKMDDLPVATHALGSTYESGPYSAPPWGRIEPTLRVGTLETWHGLHIIIGDIPMGADGDNFSSFEIEDA